MKLLCTPRSDESTFQRHRFDGGAEGLAVQTNAQARLAVATWIKRHGGPPVETGGAVYSAWVKYALVILSGASDAPLEELGQLTPLQAAQTPAMDEVARLGRVGAVRSTPVKSAPTLVGAQATLLGIDAWMHRVTPGALEAVGVDEDLALQDSAFAVSLLSADLEDGPTGPGLLFDHAPTGLTKRETTALFETVERCWREREPGLMREVSLRTLGPARGLLIDRSSRAYERTHMTPPAHFIRQRWRDYLPDGEHAPVLNTLIDLSIDALMDHEINIARKENGLGQVTLAWPWGGGNLEPLTPFAESFNLRTAAVTASDSFAGLVRLLGIDRLPAPGVSAETATEDINSLGAYAAAGLDRYDMVIAHVSGARACSLNGDGAEKTKLLERIDAGVVAPLLVKLQSFGDAEQSAASNPEEGWRMLIAVDQTCDTNRRTPTAAPCPFVMAGAWIRSVLDLPFDEHGAAQSDIGVDPGHDLMEYFLFSALKTARPRSERTRQRGGVSHG